MVVETSRWPSSSHSASSGQALDSADVVSLFEQVSAKLWRKVWLGDSGRADGKRRAWPLRGSRESFEFRRGENDGEFGGAANPFDTGDKIKLSIKHLLVKEKQSAKGLLLGRRRRCD